MEPVSVEVVSSATDDVRDLVGELDRTLAAEYLPEQRHGLQLNALFEPNVKFFIARTGGVAVGCGGVAFCGNYAELKRMYVRARARGRGVARALLATIEGAAIAHGLRVLRLETGERQVDAIRLYERAGFSKRDAFGDYASLAPRAVATSVFYEKRLA